MFRADTSIAAVAQREFPQHFPADGQVEHEPEDLWLTTVETCRSAMRSAVATARDIAAIGITISAKPRCCGSAPAAARYIGRSYGKTGDRITA
ncbi:MAG: FGGY family carbohydrate kinase [Xanthobacteraceae bacterium]